MDLISSRKKVLLIENFASDFYSSRLPYALFLFSKGWDVYAMIPGGSLFSELIMNQGIKLIEYDFNRKKSGFTNFFNIVRKLRRLQKDLKFDVIHSYRFQPNLINSIATLGLSTKKISHITGLGIVFSSKSLKFLLYKFVSQFVFYIQFFSSDIIIVQNEDDLNDIWAGFFFKIKSRVIYGSGVNLNKFNPKFHDKNLLRIKHGFKQSDSVFICVTRLIWEKGIYELVQAFEKLTLENPNIKLLIVGAPDFENPRHVNEKFIEKYNDNGNITFLGKSDEVNSLLSMSDVFIYPSYYREGIPRSLLEALSMGLPIITTDMPGCKLTVKDRLNGIIIKPKSVDEIVVGVRFILNQNLISFGSYSRKLVSEKFQDTVIYSQILNTY